MKYPLAVLIAVCCFQLSSNNLHAQYGYRAGIGGGPGYGYGGSPGYGGGYGNDCGCGNYTDPRLGYCLKNDCFCGGGGGGGGCGGGCGGGSRIIVNVRVNGQLVEPNVQMVYPPCGCGNYRANPAGPARSMAGNTGVARSTRPLPTRSGVARTQPASRGDASRVNVARVNGVGYRYKF